AGWHLPRWATVAWVIPVSTHAGEPAVFVAPARSRVHLAQHAATIRALVTAFESGMARPAFVEATSTHRSNRPRLLVVDDDEFLREALTEVLGSRYEVVTAGDVSTAKALVEKDPPDAVLADLGLPDADGRSLVN